MTDPAAPPRTEPPRVLMVDDSSASRRQLKLALEQAGISVAEASEGVEGLWRAREQAFDLILTDIHMPTMDGLEFIRELRKNPVYQHTPIYVLTSDGSRDRLKEGRAAGATAWVLKPPNLPLLVEAILKAIAFRARAAP
jgi:two-component system chemotaxis response regulator CheY